MTENKPAKRTARSLIYATILFLVVFLTFHFGTDFLSEASRALTTFIAAILLTILAFFVIYGFSDLRLHRTSYMLMGAAFLLLTYYAATPMVARSNIISKNADIPIKTLQLSAATAGFPPESASSLRDIAGQAVAPGIEHLQTNLPEKVWQILLLALAQLGLACGIGLWIGEGIDEASHLIPVAIVATVADIWSVSAGATAQIVVSSAINYFLLRFPVPGSGAIPYLIGLTDFLFFAIFYQAARRFELGARKNAIILGCSFVPAIGGALFFQTGLPVLPFMAVFFVAGNFSKLKLKKEDVKIIAAFILVILTIFSLITVALNR